MTPEQKRMVQFVCTTSRVMQVLARRLRVTIQSVGGRVELLPYVDSHYRDWLKAVQRRERVGLRMLAPWRYERPTLVPLGNLRDLLARVN